MAVQVQTPVASFTTTGVTTIFPFAFMLLDADDLVVTLDGVTVTGGFSIANIGAPAGGSVVFTTAPASGQTLVLRRVIALQRLTDYQRNGDLLAATLNLDFDRVWQALQGLRQDASRAIKLTEATLTDQTIPDDAATRAGKLVGFDPSGNAVLVDALSPGDLLVSAFIESLLTAANAASARTTLGAVGLTGAETVAGVKAFTSAPVVPDATAGKNPVTLDQLAAEEVARNAAIAAALAPALVAPTLFVSGTSVSASGVAVDFTGIPAWAKRITILFFNLSTAGVSNYIVQLGDAGGIETSGYVGVAVGYSAAANNYSAAFSSGFLLRYAAPVAASAYTGRLILERVSGNTWIASGTNTRAAANETSRTDGVKTLSDTLTQVRLTTPGGTDTFDSGTINILYE